MEVPEDVYIGLFRDKSRRQTALDFLAGHLERKLGSRDVQLLNVTDLRLPDFQT